MGRIGKRAGEIRNRHGTTALLEEAQLQDAVVSQVQAEDASDLVEARAPGGVARRRGGTSIGVWILVGVLVAAAVVAFVLLAG